MGMFSEIATEGTIGVIVREIRKELEGNRGNPAVCFALKKLGRFALTQFEWDIPAWAKEYEKVFSEKNHESSVVERAKKHWATLLLVCDVKVSDAAFGGLVVSYSEPHRKYHTLEHIVAMLDECEEIKEFLADPRAVQMAIWYHDVVYDPGTKDRRVVAGNEERSVCRAELDLKKLGEPASLISRVGELIMATTHTAPVTDPDAQFLVDLDLAILGRPEKEFDAYEEGIRKEYNWVPHADFCSGRVKILASLLGRSSIYLTQFFRRRYEHAARKNLERSIKQLQK